MADAKSYELFCVGCNVVVMARLTNGAEIYPRRGDLAELPFWKCDTCGNYVGCHHKTSNPTRPLGNIPTKELREARKQVHATLDPLWKSGKYTRKELYAFITEKIGHQFHTAETTSMAEISCVIAALQSLPPEAPNCSEVTSVAASRKSNEKSED